MLAIANRRRTDVLLPDGMLYAGGAP